jgi:ABC-type multidrug transport system ATPase subunit
MQYLLDQSKPGVWIGVEGAPPPQNVDALTGLVIMLPRTEAYETGRIQLARLVVMGPHDAHFGEPIRIKAAFVPPGGAASLDSGSKQTFHIPTFDREEHPRWQASREFQISFHPVVISLGTRKAYGEVFDRLANLAPRLLLAANDLAALNELRPASRLLQRVRGYGSDLWEKFFSEDEERFSLITFSRMLRRKESRTRSLAEVDSLDATVSLWNNRFALELRLRFPEVLGERQLQNVIIGPNGAGKTNLLLGLGRCVAKGQVVLGERDRMSLLDRATGPIPVAVFTYEPSLWKRLRGKDVQVYPQGVQPTNWRKLTQLIYELGTQDDEGHTNIRLLAEILGSVIEVAHLRWPLHTRKSDFWPTWSDRDQYFVSLSELASSPPQVFREIVMQLDRGFAPFMRSDERLFELSSGERSLVIFCVRLMNAARGGALILIDEPENHLHPRFITIMMRTLTRLLKATQSRALLVTHSPFVVRESERSAVKILKLSEGVPELFRPTMQTLGGDVSMISDHVFEDEDIKKGFEFSIDDVLQRQEQDDSVDKQAFVEDMAQELGADAVSYLLARSRALAGGKSDA